jgi:hypothetical protein
VITPGVREHFTNLTENDVDLDVELGNDSKVKAVGHGTISFQREFQQPMVVRDVLYVPGLVKSLISVFCYRGQGVRGDFPRWKSTPSS